MVITRHITASSDSPTAVALGLFDGLHLGHRAVIDRVVQRKNEGLLPTVFTFTTDAERPSAKEGAGTLMTPSRKEEMLAHLGIAWMVSPDFSSFRSLSPRAYVEEVLEKALGARFVACGYDFRFGKGAAGDTALLQELCSERGIEVEVVAHVDEGGSPVSSTRIRALLRQGKMEEAAVLLGSLFAIDFPVVHGRKLGRTLDFPTINQRFPKGFLIPRYGVYATVALAQGRWYPAVSNVGTKPTVEGSEPLCETYLMGYEGNLYGKQVEVQFLTFLRGEEKFSSLEELLTHIRSDCEKARGIALGYLEEKAGR